MTATTYYNPFSFDKVSYVIHNYSDLCGLLDIRQKPTDADTHQFESTKAKVKALLDYKSENSLPKSVRYHSASHQLIQGLMYRAIQHWCCISFKIVPIEVDLLKHNTPKSILYCVAAISIVTINHNSSQAAALHSLNKNDSQDTAHSSAIKRKPSTKAIEDFKKDIAFYFYKQACSYLDDIIFPDNENANMSVTAIQCYFCLSYTANMLRLPHEQRTWHYLACDTMRSRVHDVEMSPALLQCWYRWYYIDAWISIALNQECLLPDELPFPVIRPPLEQQQPPVAWEYSANAYYGTRSPSAVPQQPYKDQHQQLGRTPTVPRCSCRMSNDTLYEFVIMTQFMRRFNRAIRSGKLPFMYERINSETEAWWRTVKHPNLHLRNCYHSMRLVVIFSLLQHQAMFPVVHFDLLLDGLNQTLEILQGLQDLKLMHCDQSTYHHMFYAIHQTLKMILLNIRQQPEYMIMETFAKQQFEMNLCILEGTDAFRDDLYQMRSIASTIEADMLQFGFDDDAALNSKRSVRVFRAVITAKSLKKAKKSHGQNN